MSHRVLIVIFFLGLLFCASCKKEEPSVIGLDVQPTGDRILNLRHHTSFLSAFTMREDSIASDERTYNLLGNYIDPVFGLTSASFVTQVMLGTTNVVFDSVVSVDSAILYLHCKTAYPFGTVFSSVIPQNIKVYEYTGNKGNVDSWFSNANMNAVNEIDPNILANENISPIVKNDTAVLAIHINTSLAWKILQSTPVETSNPMMLLRKFKGFYVRPGIFSMGNSILSLDLLSPSTKFSLYYNTNKKYDMVVNSSCARVSLFQHDYTSTSFFSNLNREDINSDKVYMQSMSGPRILLKTPSFESWKDSGNVIINKAELIVKIDLATAVDYAPPGKLILVTTDENGKYIFLKDFIKNPVDFDGSYNQDSVLYRFQIPLHLQDIISGKIVNRGFYLFPLDNKTTANRVVLLNDATHRIAINFTYIKL